MAVINATKLDKELKDAGLPIVGCASTGRIDWADGHPTEQEGTTASAVLAKHDPTPVPKVDGKSVLLAAAKKAKTFEDLQAAVVAFAES